MSLPNEEPRNGARTAGRRGERGQDLIEFALLLPLLLFLVLGIIDFSLVFFSYNTISNAAREGARYGIIDDDVGAMETATRALTTGLDPGRLTVIPTACNGADQLTVTVHYSVPLVTGTYLIGGDGTIQLSTASTMRCEQ